MFRASIALFALVSLVIAVSQVGAAGNGSPHMSSGSSHSSGSSFHSSGGARSFSPAPRTNYAPQQNYGAQRTYSQPNYTQQNSNRSTYNQQPHYNSQQLRSTSPTYNQQNHSNYRPNTVGNGNSNWQRGTPNSSQMNSNTARTNSGHWTNSGQMNTPRVNSTNGGWPNASRGTGATTNGNYWGSRTNPGTQQHPSNSGQVNNSHWNSNGSGSNRVNGNNSRVTSSGSNSAIQNGKLNSSGVGRNGNSTVGRDSRGFLPKNVQNAHQELRKNLLSSMNHGGGAGNQHHSLGGNEAKKFNATQHGVPSHLDAKQAAHFTSFRNQINHQNQTSRLPGGAWQSKPGLQHFSSKGSFSAGDKSNLRNLAKSDPRLDSAMTRLQSHKILSKGDNAALKRGWNGTRDRNNGLFGKFRRPTGRPLPNLNRLNRFVDRRITDRLLRGGRLSKAELRDLRRAFRIARGLDWLELGLAWHYALDLGYQGDFFDATCGLMGVPIEFEPVGLPLYPGTDYSPVVDAYPIPVDPGVPDAGGVALGMIPDCTCVHGSDAAGFATTGPAVGPPGPGDLAPGPAELPGPAGPAPGPAPGVVPADVGPDGGAPADLGPDSGPGQAMADIPDNPDPSVVGNTGDPIADIGPDADQLNTEQATRYLRVANYCDTPVKLCVQYEARTEDGNWKWVPGGPGESADAEVYEMKPGEVADLSDNGWRINASRVRIWAQAGEKALNVFKDRDLWLVPETNSAGAPGYQAAEIQTFFFAVY